MRNLSHFFDFYREKADLLRTLSRRRREDEIILLVCCYIDQLGGCLFPQGSSKKSFELLLQNHSGEKDEFSRISVADLCADIIIFAESISLYVPRPGRVQLFSDEQKPLIKFIDNTGISLTQKSLYAFLYTMCDTLKKGFRIHPDQTKNKDSFGEEEIVLEAIVKVPQRGATIKEENVKSLIREYRYSSILYREYRSKAVHEVAGINVDPRNFWNARRPYFVEIFYPGTTLRALKLEFPYFFLLDCLKTCVEGAEKSIIGKGLLPLPIWRAICEQDEFQLMDVEDIVEKPIKLKID